MWKHETVLAEADSVSGKSADDGKVEPSTSRLSEWRGRVGELEVDALEALWVEAVDYTRREIRRYACWRKREEPILPGGYDAEGIVQAAFERLLIREAADDSIRYSLEELRGKLETLIRHRVRWLNERSETGVLVSEWEILALGEDDEPESVFDYLPGNIESPETALTQKERAELLERTGERIESLLGNRKDLREVFRRQWNGEKRRDIARGMGQPVKRIKAMQAQVRRRVCGVRKG